MLRPLTPHRTLSGRQGAALRSPPPSKAWAVLAASLGQATPSCLATLTVLNYNIKASFKDNSGELTNLEMMYNFLHPLLGDPESWATAAHLFLIGMVQFFLAVELLPLARFAL